MNLKKSTSCFLLCSLFCLALGSGNSMAAPARMAFTEVSETVTKPVTLNFKPAEISREIRKVNVPAANFPLTPEKALGHLADADKLLGTRLTNKGIVLLYSKKSDKQNFYSAFLSPKSLFELGETGTKTSLDLTDISISTVWGGSVPMLRIAGTFGANVEETNYFYLVNQEIRPMLVTSGNIIEVDLDQDKTPELISTGGTPQVSVLYRYKGGRVEEANLNDQLDASSIQPRRAGNTVVFDVWYQGKTKPVTFRYAKGTLQPVTS